MIKRLSNFRELLRLKPFETDSLEGRSKERYRRILLNSGSSILARVALAGLGLIIVPLVLDSFGKPEYGLWATITATTTWFTLFDFGMANGLVNAVSEAYGKQDKHLAAGYVGTAFYFLAAAAIFLVGVLLVIVLTAPLETLFGSGVSSTDSNLPLLVLSAGLPLIIAIPFTTVRQVYSGYQKSYVGNLFSIIGSLATIVAIVIAINSGASLPLITVLYIGLPGIAVAVNYLFMSKVEMPWLVLSSSQFTIHNLKRLMRTSIPLFMFQMGALLVNQTQPFVLAHRAGLGVVADYSVIIRLHQAIMSVILMSTIAFIPSFREANERGDAGWVKKSFYRMLKARIALSIGFGATLVIVGNEIIRFWIGSGEFNFGFHIWSVEAILMIASTWVTAYTDLLVVMDKIWPQVLLVMTNGVLILVLTYFLAPQFGVFGALIGTTMFTLLISSWVVPLLARNILGSKG